MSKKRKVIYIVIATFLLFFTSIFLAYANNSSIDNKYNNINRYQSYIYDSDFIPTAYIPNMIANLFFGLSKTLALITDFFIRALYENEALDSVVDNISFVSTRIYENIFGKLGALLLLITLIIFLVKYITSRTNSVKEIINVIIVIGIGVLWVSNSATLIKGANALSSELQGIIANSADNLVGKDEQLSGKDVMREKIFQKMVEEPFLIMNFDKTNKDEIGQDRVNELLKFKTDDQLEAYLKEKELNGKKEFEDYSTQNFFISSYSGTHKMIVGIISLIMNILYMIPFMIIAFFSFIIQVQIIFYILLVPFFLVLSILSLAKDSYQKIFLKMVGLYMTKAMLGLIVLFISLLMQMTSFILKNLNSSALSVYTASTIIFVLSILVLYKKRSEISQVLSHNKLTANLQLGMNGLSKANDIGSNYGNSLYNNLKHKFNKQNDEIKEDTNHHIPEASTVNHLSNNTPLERTNQKDYIDNHTLENTSSDNFDSEDKYNIDDSYIGYSNHHLEDYNTHSNSNLSSSNHLTPNHNTLRTSQAIYKGTYQNIDLAEDKYKELLNQFNSDEKLVHSLIDYASESKEKGLYKNQSDLRRMEFLTSSYKQKYGNSSYDNYSYQKINRTPQTKLTTPSYIKEQLDNFNTKDYHTNTNQADEETMLKFQELLRSKQIISKEEVEDEDKYDEEELD